METAETAWLVTSRLGTGNSLTFLQCSTSIYLNLCTYTAFLLVLLDTVPICYIVGRLGSEGRRRYLRDCGEFTLCFRYEQNFSIQSFMRIYYAKYKLTFF
jgi:hypothetical protein